MSGTTKSANGRNKRGGFPTFVRIAPPVWVVVSNIFYFHPEPWGNNPIWLPHIFQLGLVKNHILRCFPQKNNVFVPLFAGLKPPTSCTLTLFFPKLRNSHTSRYTSETPGRTVGVLQWRGRWRNDVTDWVGLNKLLGWIPFWRRKGDNRSMVDGSEIR